MTDSKIDHIELAIMGLVWAAEHKAMAESAGHEGNRALWHSRMTARVEELGDLGINVKKVLAEKTWT